MENEFKAAKSGTILKDAQKIDNDDKKYMLSKRLELNDEQLLDFMSYLFELIAQDKSEPISLDNRLIRE